MNVEQIPNYADVYMESQPAIDALREEIGGPDSGLMQPIYEERARQDNILDNKIDELEYITTRREEEVPNPDYEDEVSEYEETLREKAVNYLENFRPDEPIDPNEVEMMIGTRAFREEHGPREVPNETVMVGPRS